MKINQKALGVLILVSIFGTVFVTSGLGIWKTTNSKTPQKYVSTEYKDEYDPADIKGSYTFGEISQLYQVPLEDLAAAFSIEYEDAFSIKCKDIEAMFDSTDGKEVGTDSVRLFVALYKGLPYEMSDETYLPAAAEKILTQAGNMTEEQKLFVANHKK